MDRKFAILLSLGLGILCAFVHRFATGSLDESNSEVSQATTVSCRQLLKEWPRDNFHLRLADYQPGARIVHYDRDQDGSWDLAYLPLFPADLTTLGNNYYAVIVHFDDVKNEAELNERLAAKELDCQLWYTQQKLPPDIYSDLAREYRLMNFSRCVVVQGGFNPPNTKIAKGAVLGSYLGMIACGIVMVWNLVAILLPKPRPHKFFDEDDDAPVTNRAGLPDF